MPAPPAAPAGLTATAGDGSVTLSWDNPGDASITGYEYNVNHNDTSTGNLSGWGPWTAVDGSGAATTSHTFTGLANGREYRYHVRAVNGAGASVGAPNEPPWFAAATPSDSVPTPTPTPTPAPGLDVTNVTATTATLTIANHTGAWYYQAVGGGNTPNWPPAGSPPAMEGAGAASAQSASANPNCHGPVNGSQASINGSPGNSLVPGSNYTFTAYDNANCQGAGIASAQANSQSNAPAAPANLVGHRGYGIVDAEWTHVAGATGYNVEIYWWYIGMGWHRSATNVTGGAESTRTHRITSTGSARTPAWMGVPNHGQVLIAVQAVNANGTSGWTYSSFIDTVDFPNRPQNVTAARDTTGDTAGRITVNWGQCTPGASWCNGGTPITGYSVNASSDNGASWTTVVEAKTVSAPSASLSFCADHEEAWLVSVGVTNRLGTVYSDNMAVGRYTPTPGSRNACEDFDTLSAAGNTSPDGIWSDGTTMWVSNSADKKAYAYDMATGERDAAKDISFSGSTLRHITLASDGTTMWTSDLLDKSKLFAYSVSGRSRDTSKDITLHADNSGIYALWTDGATIWAGDDTDTYIYAYTIANSARDTGKEIDLHSGNDSVDALWSDGVTMWVADADDDKLYAYKMSDGSRDSAKDYTNLDSQNDDPFGSWSDGKTMWVANNAESNPDYEKLFAYNSMVPFTLPATVNAYRGWGFLDAEWSAVAGASSYDVEHYHAYNRARYGADWRRMGSGVTDTSLRVNGIKNWGGDKIRVRSVSPLGDTSAWSYSASVDAISGLPIAPQRLSAVRANATSLALSWTQCDVSSVLCHGGTPVTGYLVELSNDGGKTWRSGGKIAAPYTSGSAATVTQGVNTGVNRVRVSAETRFRNSGWTEAEVPAKWLTVSSITSTTATLTIGNHTGAWHYKADTGPDATCQGPVAANTSTKALAGLTAGTSYTYSAYSDSGCTADNLLATAAQFTTPALTVGSITSTGATLTLTGHTGTWSYKEIHPAAGTCASESTASKNLTLTANKTYAYTAYSDSACGTTLATVYFSTADAYVGNLDEALSIADATVGNILAHVLQRAVAFDTGNATHGYTLKGVTLRFAATTGSPASIVVAVHEPASAGSADPKATALVTLSGATQPGAGLHTFACSGSGCDLDRNATYFIVVSAPGSPANGYHSLRGTASHDETPYPAGSGWSIADTGRFREGSNAWAAPGNGDTVVMHLAAEEVVPTLTVSNIAATTATLTIAGHSGNWYYKHTNTGATCDGPVSGTTKNLTGLTAGTSYTYSAYSDSTCTTGNLLATAAEFTTPALTASNVAATTATLTISGHSGNWYHKHTNTGATCDGPVSGTTKNLTGLTAGTSYAYSAYSDSTCTATNLLATASAFTTGGVSVSNMSETSGGNHSVGGFNRTASFTTSAAYSSYTLNSVTIKFGPKNGSPNDVAVKIYSDSSGSPGSEVPNLTLTGPASPDSEDATYTCSGSGCSLSAGATYHIHLSRPGASGSYRWSKTTSDTETNVPSNAGWLIGNNGHHQTVGANYWTSSSEVGMFKVAATLPPPTLTASNVGTTTATLTRANHIGNWRYKYTTPATPAGTCSASQSGASADVTGLSPSTTYVFKLYAGTDSTCATPLATASSFTTAVSVSNMNETANSYHSVGGFNRAASFTTGANSGGYTLNSVTIKFDVKNGNPNDIAVKIYSDSSGSPGSEVANLTLTGPARPDNEDATYTCSGSGCSLSAGTTYHIHLSRPGNTGSYRWSKTTSDTETNAPSSAGWLIGNSGNYQTVGSNYWTSQGEVGMFTVTATPK